MHKNRDKQTVKIVLKDFPILFPKYFDQVLFSLFEWVDEINQNGHLIGLPVYHLNSSRIKIDDYALAPYWEKWPY